ncbi:hypothetical protein GCM10023217_16970 [Gordonia alkaliphila]|uniref:Uncharacterized protein n=1 Tax=Gordonia alkaliphila TaxID=1053547 RepID=A0ABP8Z697_9ACTN
MVVPMELAAATLPILVRGADGAVVTVDPRSCHVADFTVGELRKLAHTKAVTERGTTPRRGVG